MAVPEKAFINRIEIRFDDGVIKNLTKSEGYSFKSLPEFMQKLSLLVLSFR